MPQEGELDLAFVRAQFPNIGKLAFFENAGGTFVPRTVIDKVREYMSENQVQPGGDYEPSIRAAEKMAESHRMMAQMLNAATEEVVIGISTSMNIYLLAQAIRHWFTPGDEVIVTNSFVVENRDSADFPLRLGKHDIGIRAGHFYAKRLIDALGLDKQNGVVRASLVHYNSMEEIDRLIRCLDEVI